MESDRTQEFPTPETNKLEEKEKEKEKEDGNDAKGAEEEAKKEEEEEEKEKKTTNEDEEEKKEEIILRPRGLASLGRLSFDRHGKTGARWKV